jgi:hypothetical protein
MSGRELDYRDYLDEHSRLHPPKNTLSRFMFKIWGSETAVFIGAAAGEATGKLPVDRLAVTLNSLSSLHGEIPTSPRFTVGYLLAGAFLTGAAAVASGVATIRSERPRTR